MIGGERYNVVRYIDRSGLAVEAHGGGLETHVHERKHLAGGIQVRRQSANSQAPSSFRYQCFETLQNNVHSVCFTPYLAFFGLEHS